MCETGGYGSAHPHLIITDGSHVYAVNTGLPLADQAKEFAEHGNIQLPLRVNSTTDFIKPTHCAYLFGYLIVNDAGTDAFYTSYQYPFETYTEAILSTGTYLESRLLNLRTMASLLILNGNLTPQLPFARMVLSFTH